MLVHDKLFQFFWLFLFPHEKNLKNIFSAYYFLQGGEIAENLLQMNMFCDAKSDFQWKVYIQFMD